MTVLEQIVKGDTLPEINFNVSLDDRSLIKFALAEICVVVICLLIAALLKK